MKNVSGLRATININKETSQIVIFNSTIDFVSVVCEIVWRFPRRSYLIQSCSWPSTWTRNRKMIFRGGNFHAWLYHLPLKWSKGLLVYVFFVSKIFWYIVQNSITFILHTYVCINSNNWKISTACSGSWIQVLN